MAIMFYVQKMTTYVTSYTHNMIDAIAIISIPSVPIVPETWFGLI